MWYGKAGGVFLLFILEKISAIRVLKTINND